MKRIVYTQWLVQIVIVLMTVTYSPCCAQQKGCFAASSDGAVKLETTIDLSKHNAYLVGELHGVYGVPGMKLGLIKYLNTRYGITDVFIETGNAAAYLFNSFLETGDTAFITHPHLLYTATKPDMDFWLGLYEYNKDLSRKIRIRGMDFERAEWLRVLQLLLPPGRERPRALYNWLHYIDTVHVTDIGWLGSRPFVAADSMLQVLRADAADNKAAWQDFWGEDYPIVERLLLNRSRATEKDTRNVAMYGNIDQQVMEDGIDKFVVFCGQAHADKANKGSLAGLLLSNKKYRSKLACMAMACKNCYDWQQPGSGIAPYRAPYTYYKDSALLDGIFDKYFDGNCKYTLLPSKTIEDGKVYRYSDYLILLKDQPVY